VPEADLVRTDGSATTLSDAVGGKPAVLVFYRGAWCPYCNIALQTYQRDLLPGLRDRGVELVAISPQTPEGSEQAVQNGGLKFTVLSDPSNALVRRLGILTEPTGDARTAHTALGFDVADSNADATGDIPFPTVLVIDADRVVRFADVHVDYTTRTEVPTILEAVDRL
jgi:peroxiredoxin